MRDDKTKRPARSQFAARVSALTYQWTYVRVAHRADEDLFAFLGDRLPGSRVLDCGCGPGMLAEKLARQGVEHLVAVDADASMVRQARRRLAPALSAGTVDVVHARVDECFFRDGGRAFDLVVFKRSLYAPPPAAVATLQAAVAAIEPPGLVVVVHPERSLRRYAFGRPPRLRGHSAFHLLNRFVSRLAARLGLGDYQVYTSGELRDLLAQAAPGRPIRAAPTSQDAYNIAAIMVDQSSSESTDAGAS